MNLLDKAIRYFDLFSNSRSPVAMGRTAAKEPPASIWLLAHYLSLYAGIVAQTFLESRRSGTPFSFGWVRLLVAAIVATAVFPAVYKEAMKERAPGFVQCCVTFTSGLGYKMLIDVTV